MQHDSSFRAAVHRLNTTPVAELPRITAFLSSEIASYDLQRLFSDSKENASAVTSHKLKTRVTSLLQDRTQSGRLSATILVKTLIDHGGPTLLASSAPWARSLLNCLNKPDAPEVKKLYLVTITRLFILTHGQPTLLREITTPLLPTFITTCLNLIRPIQVHSEERQTSIASPLLDPVLQCWLQLIPQHGSVFRPFVGRIRPICLALLSENDTSESSVKLVTRVLCSLVSCAPKGGSVQEWTQISTNLLLTIHETANQIFRGVLEEFESNDSSLTISLGKRDFSEPPEQAGIDQLGLGPWVGIAAGSIRLSRLIAWLECLISTPTLQAVPIRLGATMDMTTRLMEVTVPTNQATTTQQLRFHKEVSREEKEELFLSLPSLHISCLQLLKTLFSAFDQSLSPLYELVCNQVLDLFEAMAFHSEVRAFSYQLLQVLIQNASLWHLDVNKKLFSTFLVRCCHDLQAGFAGFQSAHPEKSKEISLPSAVNAKPARSMGKSQSTVYKSAWKLLPAVLGPSTSHLLSRQVRTEIDRIAILLNHEKAMLASVLNPAVSENGKATTASLLPFLVRSCPDSPAVDVLLRPRFPIIPTQYESSQPLDRLAEDPQSVEGNDAQASEVQKIDHNDHLDSTMRDEGDGPIQGLNGYTDGQQQSLQSPAKRSFENVQEEQSDLYAAGDGNVEPKTKKARSDDVSINDEVSMEQPESPVVDEQPETAVARATGSESITTMEAARGLQSTAPAINNLSQVNQNRRVEIADSDESDFEIPTIDPELDTDEEEDD